MIVCQLTLNLLTTTIVAPPINASKWQMGFNSAFKGLIVHLLVIVQNNKRCGVQVLKYFHMRKLKCGFVYGARSN